MTILWCGGEDIDFSFPSLCGNYNGSGWYDGDYARNSIANSAMVYSQPIETPVTSAWLSCRQYRAYTDGATIYNIIGFADYATGKAICLGSVDYVPTLYAWDGSAWTVLASAPSVVYNNGSALNRIDIQLTGYGASANIKVYYAGDLAIDFTGDASISGVSGFDCVTMKGGTVGKQSISEIVLANEDTRGFRVLTLVPTSAGDTNEFDYGDYTDVDELIYSDADQIYASSADETFLCNTNGMPSGDFVIKAVKVAARCVDGTGSLGIKLGVKSGGTVNVGTAQECSGFWQTKERLMLLNGAAPFTASDIESLQLAVKSGAV